MQKQDSLSKKLAAYTVLAEAFLLANPGVADAQIMYTDVNPDLEISNGYFNLDLNNDAIPDVKLLNWQYINATGGGTSYWGFINKAYPIGSNENEVNPSYNIIPVNFNSPIGPSNQFSPFADLLRSHYGGVVVWTNTMSSTVISSWTQQWDETYGYFFGSNKILGLSVKAGGNTYYGWVRLDVYDDHITIKDYAINTVPDSSILAGDSAVGCAASPVNITPVGEQIICANDSAYITAQNTNGQNIQWLFNGNFIAGATDSIYNPNSEGLHSVLVSSGNCSVIAGHLQVDTASFHVYAYPQNATCGLINGDINIGVGGNLAPYAFQWNTGATSEDLHLVAPGNYSVTVTASQCNVSDTILINITDIPGPVISETHTDSACGNDGMIDLTVTNGTPPYYFSWSNSVSTEDQYNLAAGIYSVTLTDNNSCVATDTIIIQNTGADLNFVYTDTVCTSNGYIDLTLSGGIPPYTFLWSNGVTNEDLSGLFTGYYRVTVTDGSGCNSVSDWIHIAYTPFITPVITMNNDTLWVNPAYSAYQWYRTVTLLTGATNQYYYPQQTGGYKVLVTDACGRTGVSSIYHVWLNNQDITQPEEIPEISVKEKHLNICFPDNSFLGAEFIIVNAQGQMLHRQIAEALNLIIDLNGLPAGIYFLRFRNNKKNYSAKFLLE